MAFVRHHAIELPGQPQCFFVVAEVFERDDNVFAIVAPRIPDGGIVLYQLLPMLHDALFVNALRFVVAAHRQLRELLRSRKRTRADQRR